MSIKFKGILVSDNSNILEKYCEALQDTFDISVFSDNTLALSYFIENNLNLDFYIISYSDSSKDSIDFFMNKIREINPAIKEILIELDDNYNMDEFRHSLNFIKGQDVSEISNSILEYLENTNKDSIKRQYSRVNWPLNVIVAFADKHTIERNILSISGNGAYISSDTNIPKKDEEVSLTISFKDFKLFTKANVVFININNERPNFPKGFAVQFIDIGAASQKIIDQIIKDKLLENILIEYEDGHFNE